MRFDGSCEQSNIPQGARAATVFSHPSYVSPPLLASWPSMRKHNVIRLGGELRGSLSRAGARGIRHAADLVRDVFLLQ